MPRTSTVPVRCRSVCSFPALWFTSRIFSVKSMGQLLTLYFWWLNLSHGLFKDHPSKASGLFPTDPQVYRNYLCAYLWTVVWTSIFFLLPHPYIFILLFFATCFSLYKFFWNSKLSFNLFFSFSLPDILKTSLGTQPTSGWCLHHKLVLAHQAPHSLRCSSPYHCDLSLTRTH